MSEERKLAQELKKKNQNLSYENHNGVLSNQHIVRAEKDRNLEAIIDFWCNGDDTYFRPKKRESILKSLKIYLDYCDKMGYQKRGVYNGQDFSVSDENPLDVSFYEDPVASWILFSRTPRKTVTIDESGTKYSMEFSLERDMQTTIRGPQKQVLDNFYLRRSVVISGDDITEYCRFNSTGYDAVDKQIRALIIANNPNFVSADTNRSNVINEMYRKNISKEESVSPEMDIVGNIGKHMQIETSPKFGEKKPAVSYGFFVEKAKEKVSDCQEIYSMISEVYKDKQQFSSVGVESIDEIQNNNQDDVRARKINRAKELIKLSKQQDEEISELEAKNEKEGEEYGE